jgi:hypothetical protein
MQFMMISFSKLDSRSLRVGADGNSAKIDRCGIDRLGSPRRHNQLKLRRLSVRERMSGNPGRKSNESSSDDGDSHAIFSPCSLELHKQLQEGRVLSLLF